VDFTPGETQQAIARVAASVLGPAGTIAAGQRARRPGAGQQRGDGPQGQQERLGQEERRGGAIRPGQVRPGQVRPGQVRPGQVRPEADFNAATWKELGQAGLLSLSLPDWLGGDGLGVLEAAAVLTEIGARAAAVPALATLALGVLPVTRWGDRDLQQAVLAGVGAGKVVLTAAVREASDPMPQAPATVVSAAGTVSGVKVGVPDAGAAAWLLVPASFAAGGTGVVIVERAAAGVALTAGPGPGGAREHTVRLDQAPVGWVLGHQRPGHGTDGRVLADLYQLAMAGACALADGAAPCSST
jgi:3-oxo-4-pregnene-20-carboxyl-CoA dehydrogenase alpha subunit